jgi:hypothetical protein
MAPIAGQLPALAPWPPAARQRADPASPATVAPARSAAHPASEFTPGDNGFIALCQAYRASGGISRGSDLAHWMVGRGQGDTRHLAALIVGGEAFSFDWRGTFWVPMFQFNPLQPAWGDGARQVLTELRPVLDGWSLAGWFVRGNGWLAGERPLDLLATAPQQVLAAARADRYVITG